MDLDKKLALFYRKLKELGFNTVVFNDGDKIICLEIPTKNFKARIRKNREKLSLFIPFLGSVEKEIKDSLESNFIKIAGNKIKNYVPPTAN